MVDGWMVGRLGEYAYENMGRVKYGKVSSEALSEPEFPRSSVKLMGMFSLASVDLS